MSNKHLSITSIRFDNVCVLLQWIYLFWLEGKSLLEYTNLFSLKEYEKNEKIILNYF